MQGSVSEASIARPGPFRQALETWAGERPQIKKGGIVCPYFQICSVYDEIVQGTDCCCVFLFFRLGHESL